METNDEVAIITTMLRQLLLAVGELAETVHDIKEEVKCLKRASELAQDLEAKVKKNENEDALPETVSRPNRVKLPRMLQGKTKKVTNDFSVGDVVRFTDDETKEGTIERVSEKSVWVKLPRKKKLQLKRKHKVVKVDADV